MTKLPTAVPLPEVCKYADDIAVSFDNLGFPVGFDEERLQVNLRAISWVTSAARLGDVTVMGAQGQAEALNIAIGSITPSGEATMAGASSRNRKPLSVGNVHFPSDNEFFGPADVTIKINTTERDDRIQAGNYKRGLLSPEAHAEYLDKSLGHGLVQASRHANLTTNKLISGAGFLIGTEIGQFMSAHVDVNANALGQLPILVAAAQMFGNGVEYFAQRGTSEGDSHYKDYRKSVTGLVMAPERYAAAIGLRSVSTFVKVRT